MAEDDRIIMWDDKKKEVVIFKEDDDDCLLKGPCLTVSCPDTNPKWRYGIFDNGKWEHVPFDDFPPEFKLWLLIEGVT